MTAKEMFEELGYKEKWSTNTIERYEKTENCICFYKNKKAYESYYSGDEGAMSVYLTVDEHKAIHRRMKELGWIFDNPPLKFEELEEGMWVWDNKKKCYLQCNPAISTEMAECVWYESFWYNDGKDYDEFYEDYLEFEENCFYRKQVEE